MIYVKLRAESMGPVVDPDDVYFEIDGETVTRQVNHWGDRWLCSLDDWFEPVGMLLTDQPVPRDDYTEREMISTEEFEEAWARALRERSGQMPV